jgi:hypothetical protein
MGGQALPALQTIALDLLITKPSKTKEILMYAFVGKSYIGGFI